MCERTLSNKKQNTLIFLCWLVYVVAYLGRYSYSSNIKIIGDFFGVGTDQTGLVTTTFFFCYGAGQIINGLLCKRYNKRIILSLALVFSAIINLAIGLGVPFAYFKYLWLINGAVQSVLWSSLILVLSENLDDAHLKKAVLVMCTCVPAGTFIIYGISALFSIFTSYNATFILVFAVLVVVGVVWFFGYANNSAPKQASIQPSANNQTSHGKISPSLFIMIVLICLFAIVCNLVKDGLQTWTPDILGANFTLPNALSITLTLLLPLVGVFGATLAVKIHEVISNYVVVIGLFFLFAGLLMTGVALLMQVSWVPVIVLMSLAFCASQGINNIITSVAPLELRKHVNSGALTGIVNGCCYVGSTISGYGLGSLVEGTGNWLNVFWLLIGLSALSVIIAVTYAVVGKIINKKQKPL